MLLHASKAWAWLAGKQYVTPDEIKAVAKPTLRHRVELRPEVELIEGITFYRTPAPVPGPSPLGEWREVEERQGRTTEEKMIFKLPRQLTE